MEIEEDIISKNFISIMIVFKNEGRYLKEWIDFHLLSGIDHFYLYDNSTTEDPLPLLKKYIEEKKVTYIKWDFDLLNNPAAAPHRNHFITNYGHETIWCAFTDLDEYIFPLQHNNLKEYFDEKIGNNVSCVILPSTFFGSNNKKKYVKSPPTYKRFTKRNKIGNNIFGPGGTTEYKKIKGHVGNLIYKSIVKVGHIKKFNSSHKITTNLLTVTESLSTLTIKDSNTAMLYNRIYEAEYIRLNHYWCRSEEEYNEVKNFHPGRDGRIDDEWRKLDKLSNEFQETTIIDFVEKCKPQSANSEVKVEEKIKKEEKLHIKLQNKINKLTIKHKKIQDEINECENDVILKNETIKELKKYNKYITNLNLIFHEIIEGNKYEKIYCFKYNDNEECILCNKGVGFMDIKLENEEDRVKRKKQKEKEKTSALEREIKIIKKTNKHKKNKIPINTKKIKKKLYSQNRYKKKHKGGYKRLKNKNINYGT